ncbi:NAD(P)H-dependent oxidoreductase [Actinosynnema sp. NPDC047251]|uniref:FMN dependent NADH:quinone oxidoreductase n=1 Tax=Saccharothrix espanaensis (strain ATCC 51144 / DSM 44229 / JCM 9112 / NBRC 15066 / NRRL 15764) TaxID=1179773 RepID=K0K9F9_SACES|nr:NAD(P)H-dependent oxidoreductase [Saccharothrix espanaensis]CCH33464.1 NAD(P)H dehydrogenase (quinone) [Saccharothrix espanaensis DSM 44229]
MTKLLHVSASPRAEASESLVIASAFVDAYRESHPDDEVEHWDLWDGTLPAFGPAATAAKMAVIRGDEPTGDEVAAWREVVAAAERFTSADRLLFSVPMWNSGIPYVLKQFVDVVSQPGMVFGLDVETGYLPLLAGHGKRAAVVYTSSVWGPEVAPGFGSNFQSTYFDDWLRWTGITDLTTIRHHPTLSGDAEDSRQTALATAREAAKTF